MDNLSDDVKAWATRSNFQPLKRKIQEAYAGLDDVANFIDSHGGSPKIVRALRKAADAVASAGVVFDKEYR